MTLNKTFSKLFSWPIPYWLTPVGVLLLVGYWYGFSWKVNTENWPFWLWLTDKGITVGSIFGAAYWAQRIFNENALNRENRDRRLNAVIDLSKEQSKAVTECLNIEDDYDECYELFQYLALFHKNLSNSIRIHQLGLNRESDNVYESIKTLGEIHKSCKPILRDNHIKVSRVLPKETAEKYTKQVDIILRLLGEFEDNLIEKFLKIKTGQA